MAIKIVEGEEQIKLYRKLRAERDKLMKDNDHKLVCRSQYTIAFHYMYCKYWDAIGAMTKDEIPEGEMLGGMPDLRRSIEGHKNVTKRWGGDYSFIEEHYSDIIKKYDLP